MKKVYNIKNLDCIDDTLHVEYEIRKVSGVKKATISFISEKLRVEFKDGIDIKTTLEEMRKVAKTVKSNCEII